MTRKTKTNRGFSLIELMVVLGIFGLLSASVMSNYSEFSVRASLDNLTHLVAVSIRQAQVYGISVSQARSSFKGYGMYFSVASLNDKKNFILFSDLDSDKLFDGAMASECTEMPECVTKTKITTGDTVSAIWAKKNTDPANAVQLGEVHIVFTRPNPDAVMYGKLLGSGDFEEDPFADVEITLTSARGTYSKEVVIWSTGQVSVEDTEE